jgi:hypothetical protein
MVSMAKTRILKSRMKRKFHVRFGSGGGVGDCPADHNLGGICQTELRLIVVSK